MEANEATFEARIHSELQRLFPTLAPLQFTHQITLTLRLGRRTLRIGPQDTARGRLDVLVHFRSRPLLILELKSPGEPLTDDDRDQAISYGRLLTPMPPLAVVSNGSDHRFYNTYDKAPWHPSSLDGSTLEGLIENGLTCAATDRDEAVRFLLGRHTSMWADVIRHHTDEALRALSGGLADFGRG